MTRRDPRRIVPAEKPARWVPGDAARVISAEHGLDLAHFVVQASRQRLSVRQARRLLEQGGCRINGRTETFGSRKLQRGEVVELILPEEDAEHRFDPRRVLHQDPFLLAYDKPAFLPVVRGDSHGDWSLTDILKAAIPGGVIPVHRLDADTSGLVLFARTERCARRLEEAFSGHQVEKTYLALVRGHPPETGRRRTYLIKVEGRKGFEKWATGKGPAAREAITEWTVLERLGRFASLVEVSPRTGRHHQIRVHFSEIGHALYGDRIYGDRSDPVHVHRQMLHAVRIRFAHPEDGRPIELEAPLPRDFQAAMRSVQKA